MSYFPEQRIITSQGHFERETRLPAEAIGVVLMTEGRAVDVRDKVLRGFVPSRHVIIEAAQELRLNDPAELSKLLLVKERVVVEKGTAIAGRDPKRGKRIFAPIDGLIVYVGGGRIIMQAAPEVFELEAGVRGTVSAIYGNEGLSISTSGAILQGVWGNDQRRIAYLRLEPADGVEVLSPDSLDQAYRNEIVVSTRPISERALYIAEERNFAGLIAPSMSANLIPRVMAMEMAVLLTEGFGNLTMSEQALALLREFESYQAIIDAYKPRRSAARRPELVIPRAGDAPQAVDLHLVLRRNSKVRVVREPYYGQQGRVVDLPRGLMTLPNGLRVACATVDLGLGEVVQIPLANLEVSGR
ncbi:MAG: hypothetical protein NZ750_12940 [Anaerolineae bacterium]|nr:hypothetical protein [Anaerolineae bacterium]MDW8173682.1 hypothetical protein [Anaerolineae bacterium]